MAEQITESASRGLSGFGGAGVPDDREDRLLPWPSVRQIAGISRTTAWRLQQTGDFPHPVPISANRVGWWESDLTAWKAQRRLAIRPRPRPFGQTAPAREAPRISRIDPDPAPPTQAGRCGTTGPEPVRPGLASRRRVRARPVSPDQIDFGF